MNDTGRKPRRVTRIVSGGEAVGLEERAPAAGVDGPPRRAVRGLPRRLHLSVEQLSYVLIGALAALTRFWDLSSRAEHHDESLHAYFSWLFYVGDGYVHDPLMHGPSLFLSNALAYLLFGDNDYTSRLVPAVLGTLLVLMPYLLRGPQLLGRWGALACSALLLFSPTLLYQARYIRHDPIVLVCTLGIVIGSLRYLERPERRWVVLVGVLAGLLFATMEVFYIIAFALVTFVVGVASWQVSKRLFAVIVGTGLALLATWKVMPGIGAGPLPTIPWEHPTNENVRDFAFDIVQHPTVLASIGVLLLGLIVALGVLDKLRHPAERGWVDGVLKHTPPHTTAHTLYFLLSDRRSLWLGIGGGLTIVVVLYTTFFTNMPGLASGTFGALGYWLGQQGVQRADQPWFYYMLMLPQYEFVAVLLFPVAVIATAWRLIPRLRRREPVGRRVYLRAFVIYWALVNLAVFSWAGEKMPWLTVHMALPLIILAASMLGAAAERIEALYRAGRLSRGAALPALGVPLVVAGWFYLWAWASAGPWEIRGNDLVRTLRPSVADNPWLLYVPLLALLALLGYAVWRLGIRAAALVAGVSFVAVVVLGQAHVSYRMAYQEGDVPRDMLIYVQTSPDVPRVVEELGILSRELTGGLDMPIYYDAGTSWPFQWYLRDYTQRRYFGTTLNEPPDAPIVLISNEHLTSDNQEMLAGYTFVEYAMRWWFPEDETYRRFAIAPELNKTERQNYQTDEPGPYSLFDVAESVWRSLWGMHEPAEQAKMFRLVAYRELWAPIGSYNFRVYVRNDLLQTYNDIRY